MAVLAQPQGGSINTELNISPFCTTQKEYLLYDSTKSGQREEKSEGGGGGKEKRKVHRDSNPGRFTLQSTDLTAPPSKLERPSNASLRF